jgi:hypothetical protein
VIILPFLAVGWAALLSGLGRRVGGALGCSVLAVGLVVQLPGVVVDYAKVSQTASAGRGGFSTAERQWSWAVAPLVLNARAAVEAVPANVDYVLGRAPIPRISAAAGADDRGFSQQFAFSLDFWWLYLFYMGVLPRLGVAVVILAGLGWVILCLWQLKRA